MMDIIRFSILLSALLFANWATYTAEKNVEELRLNKKPFVSVNNEIADEHHSFVGRALEMHRSSTEKNGDAEPATVIVKEGKIIGEGSDRSTHLTDPSAHAAVTAVREACRNIEKTSLRGCTLYSTTELCPMCLSLLYVAGIDKIIYCVPSEDGLSAETSMSERIQEAMKQKEGQRPIPEIFVPYKMIDP
ncbi:MAG TPA: nucleoside deaminase [Chryseolinea sp.]